MSSSSHIKSRQFLVDTITLLAFQVLGQYPLVNFHITMEHHHAINGKWDNFRIFDWVIFNSKLFVIANSPFLWPFER